MNLEENSQTSFFTQCLDYKIHGVCPIICLIYGFMALFSSDFRPRIIAIHWLSFLFLFIHTLTKTISIYPFTGSVYFIIKIIHFATILFFMTIRCFFCVAWLASYITNKRVRKVIDIVLVSVFATLWGAIAAVALYEFHFGTGGDVEATLSAFKVAVLVFTLFLTGAFSLFSLSLPLFVDKNNFSFFHIKIDESSTDTQFGTFKDPQTDTTVQPGDKPSLYLLNPDLSTNLESSFCYSTQRLAGTSIEPDVLPATPTQSYSQTRPRPQSNTPSVHMSQSGADGPERKQIISIIHDLKTPEIRQIQRSHRKPSVALKQARGFVKQRYADFLDMTVLKSMLCYTLATETLFLVFIVLKYRAFIVSEVNGPRKFFEELTHLVFYIFSVFVLFRTPSEQTPKTPLETTKTAHISELTNKYFDHQKSFSIAMNLVVLHQFVITHPIYISDQDLLACMRDILHGIKRADTPGARTTSAQRGNAFDAALAKPTRLKERKTTTCSIYTDHSSRQEMRTIDENSENCFEEETCRIFKTREMFNSFHHSNSFEHFSKAELAQFPSMTRAFCKFWETAIDNQCVNLVSGKNLKFSNSTKTFLRMMKEDAVRTVCLTLLRPLRVILRRTRFQNPELVTGSELAHMNCWTTMMQGISEIRTTNIFPDNVSRLISSVRARIDDVGFHFGNLCKPDICKKASFVFGSLDQFDARINDVILVLQYYGVAVPTNFAQVIKPNKSFSSINFLVQRMDVPKLLVSKIVQSYEMTFPDSRIFTQSTESEKLASTDQTLHITDNISSSDISVLQKYFQNAEHKLVDDSNPSEQKKCLSNPPPSRNTFTSLNSAQNSEGEMSTVGLLEAPFELTEIKEHRSSSLTVSRAGLDNISNFSDISSSFLPSVHEQSDIRYSYGTTVTHHTESLLQGGLMGPYDGSLHESALYFLSSDTAEPGIYPQSHTPTFPVSPETSYDSAYIAQNIQPIICTPKPTTNRDLYPDRISTEQPVDKQAARSLFGKPPLHSSYHSNTSDCAEDISSNSTVIFSFDKKMTPSVTQNGLRKVFCDGYMNVSGPFITPKHHGPLTLGEHSLTNALNTVGAPFLREHTDEVGALLTDQHTPMEPFISDTNRTTLDFDHREDPISFSLQDLRILREANTTRLQKTHLTSHPDSFVPPGYILSILKRENTQMYLEHFLTSWDFNSFIVNKLSNHHPVVSVGLAIHQQQPSLFPSILKPFNMTRFSRFLLLVERTYRNNPYHNASHAADVMQFVNNLMLAIRKEAFDRCQPSSSEFEKIFSDLEVNHKRARRRKKAKPPLYKAFPKRTDAKHRSGRIKSNLEQVERWLPEPLRALIVLAALLHDADHPGYNNRFLCDCRHPLSNLYNNSSTIEMHSISLGLSLLEKVGFQLPQKARRCLRCIIMVTDMTFHKRIIDMSQLMLSMLSESSNLHSSVTRKLGRLGPYNIEGFFTDFENFRKPSERNLAQRARSLLVYLLMKVSDISNQLRPLEVARKWSEAMSEEFFNHGDLFRGMGLQPDKFGFRERKSEQYLALSQAEFINFVVFPLQNQLQTFATAVLGVPSDLLTSAWSLASNFRRWKEASGQ
eukprot:gnl/Chilomastix_cuspidata/1110.p1 GENE.gnl/Chilomastix_cuspidata/1110~~gnl/Chilomastix_cuspidata/1110.p1  ORF type:complete len:1582 (+),score=255.39 gnl/Chilomastix_cuspidata/1110:146-4891(+)